ncbi:MAG TPA: sugar phosphate isomerase/epimerase family protein [Geminicoccaceae bacterium]|nr:sugar phosphate isomerase/epimerase family protein [Geminicoccaceae bacterium]
MNISLCNEVVRTLDFRAQCALARALGYDGLELAPFTLGPEPHRLAASRRAELRRVADDQGLRITGLHWLLVTPDGLSITSRDEGIRARTVDVMRRLIELCADLGGTVLVHGSPQQRPLEPGDSRDVALARAAECFAAVAADAEEARVTYCIEPLAPAETRLINTVAEAASIVEQTGSPALCTMIDTCAAGQSEAQPIPELIERWLPTGLIAHIHLNDPNRHAPGQGDLRFGPILAALEDHGYAGICSVEPFVYEPDGPGCAARAIGYLRGLEEALARRPTRSKTV